MVWLKFLCKEAEEEHQSVVPIQTLRTIIPIDLVISENFNVISFMMADKDFMTSLISGGMAGIAVDISLFPLDTIKTRLQSKQGFLAAGGFKKIYSGIGPAAVGSAPNAAIFFCTYDTVKKISVKKLGCQDGALVHMSAASLGEVTACLVRVPVEIVKQRRQAGLGTSMSIVRSTWQAEGLRGFYRGYLTTVAREIPFSLIQFPLWEYLKKKWSSISGETPKPWEASLCGGIAGGIAAGLTTPLDVAKTRIMLASSGSAESTGGTLEIWRLVIKESGVRGLFAGLIPRVTWISVGGAVFFGVYEKCKSMLTIL